MQQRAVCIPHPVLWLCCRQRVQVSASSKLVPVAHAAEIRSSSRGNLLRQLLSANVDADLYGKELVRAVINVSAVWSLLIFVDLSWLVQQYPARVSGFWRFCSIQKMVKGGNAASCICQLLA